MPSTAPQSDVGGYPTACRKLVGRRPRQPHIPDHFLRATINLELVSLGSVFAAEAKSRPPGLHVHDLPDDLQHAGRLLPPADSADGAIRRPPRQRHCQYLPGATALELGVH
jgi:hypothetical protein